jgi:hypothetical protein
MRIVRHTKEFKDKEIKGRAFVGRAMIFLNRFVFVMETR